MAIASDSSLDVRHSDNIQRIKVGVVVYQMSHDGRSLAAEWYHTDVDSNLVGRGEAIRISGTNFEGEFDITYKYADDTLAGQFRLRVVKQKDVYSLSWTNAGITLFEGIGIETVHGLVAGWNHAPKSA